MCPQALKDLHPCQNVTHMCTIMRQPAKMSLICVQAPATLHLHTGDTYVCTGSCKVCICIKVVFGDTGLLQAHLAGPAEPVWHAFEIHKYMNGTLVCTGTCEVGICTKVAFGDSCSSTYLAGPAEPV